MRPRFASVVLALALTAGLLGVHPAAADDPSTDGAGSPNLSHVDNIPYAGSSEFDGLMKGSDLEFHTIGGRDYAFAGAYITGLHIVDITDPDDAQLVAVYDCGIAQGDIQIFEQGASVYVAYTADIYSATKRDTACFQDAQFRIGRIPSPPYGTFLIDVTDPAGPVAVNFVQITKGSHNVTVHPDGAYLYNSNSEIVPSRSDPPAIEVFDISDVTDPSFVTKLSLTTGLESHDITFSEDGTRAYSAALTHTLVLDTTDPAAPEIIGRIADPTINIHHQADPVTVTDPILGERTFLVVTDEVGGASGNVACPGGGLHVFDITGPLELAPVKVGFFVIPEVRLAEGSHGAFERCTAHVLRMYPDEGVMTIGWYNAGVRVLDISGLAGVSAGLTPEAGSTGAGIREIGWYTFPDSDTWTAKVRRFDEDGSFHLFANDARRGFDVYRFDASAPESSDGGLWLSPQAAATRLLPASALKTATSAPYCVIALR